MRASEPAVCKTNHCRCQAPDPYGCPCRYTDLNQADRSDTVAFAGAADNYCGSVPHLSVREHSPRVHSGPHVPATPGGARLTPRERELLGLLADGVTSNDAIAERMGISENTVKFHVARLFASFNVHDRGAAVARAFRLGIVR